jgi:hypothetical protein
MPGGARMLKPNSSLYKMQLNKTLVFLGINWLSANGFWVSRLFLPGSSYAITLANNPFLVYDFYCLENDLWMA